MTCVSVLCIGVIGMNYLDGSRPFISYLNDRSFARQMFRSLRLPKHDDLVVSVSKKEFGQLLFFPRVCFLC